MSTRFAGRQQNSLRAHFGLPFVEREGEDARRLVSVAFEILDPTVSGIQMQYLLVSEKNGYQAVHLVRWRLSHPSVASHFPVLSVRK
jgi:AP-1 complex subunit mu